MPSKKSANYSKAVLDTSEDIVSRFCFIIALSANYKLKEIFHIGSTADSEISQPVLLMEIGSNHFSYAVMNNVGWELKEAAFYTIDGDLENLFENVLKKAPDTFGSFYQVQISYLIPESILVPFRYFNHENASSLLNTMFGITGNEIVIAEPVTEWQVQNVYRILRPLHQMIEKQFPTGKYWHAYSIALKSSLATNEIARLQLDFKPHLFSVLLLKENVVQLTQIFEYKIPDDVLYFLLRICVNFGILQDEVDIVVTGLIEESSGLYAELCKYFRNVSFGKLNSNIQFSTVFENHPPHYFSSIYNLAACVS